MQNLFEQIVKSAPVANRLPFGLNENIIITNVDINPRKRKGMPVKQNTFITFSQIDPETEEIVAQNEAAYWNLQHTSEYTMRNFDEQASSMIAIVEALGGDLEKFDEAVEEGLDMEEEEFNKTLKTLKGVQKVQKVLSETFYNFVKDIVGPSCPRLKVKTKVDKKGYFEMSKENTWILPMDSKEELAKITPRERRVYKESLKASTTKTKAKPDLVGAPKLEKAVGKANFDGLQ